MRGVVDKFLPQFEAQLAEKRVGITFSGALRKHLVKAGFDAFMAPGRCGASSRTPCTVHWQTNCCLASLVDGGLVSVDIDEAAAEKDKITIDITPPETRPKKKVAEDDAV